MTRTGKYTTARVKTDFDGRLSEMGIRGGTRTNRNVGSVTTCRALSALKDSRVRNICFTPYCEGHTNKEKLCRNGRVYHRPDRKTGRGNSSLKPSLQSVCVCVKPSELTIARPTLVVRGHHRRVHDQCGMS